MSNERQTIYSIIEAWHALNPEAIVSVEYVRVYTTLVDISLGNRAFAIRVYGPVMGSQPRAQVVGALRFLKGEPPPAGVIGSFTSNGSTHGISPGGDIT